MWIFLSTKFKSAPWTEAINIPGKYSMLKTTNSLCGSVNCRTNSKCFTSHYKLARESWKCIFSNVNAKLFSWFNSVSQTSNIIEHVVKNTIFLSIVDKTFQFQEKCEEKGKIYNHIGQFQTVNGKIQEKYMQQVESSNLI